MSLNSPIAFPAGEVLGTDTGFASDNLVLTGILVSAGVTVKNVHVFSNSTTYTVPAGKSFYVLSIFDYNDYGACLTDNTTGNSVYCVSSDVPEVSLTTPLVFPAGEVIGTDGNDDLVISGYVK
jgi:hypothetical protein